MARAYVIFKEEGEYADYQKDLLAVALSEEGASAEVRKQADAFVEEQKPHTSQATPIKILGSAPSLTVRIGKMGYGPRDVHFSVEEVHLAESV